MKKKPQHNEEALKEGNQCIVLGLGVGGFGAATVNRKWIALPMVVQAFLLQHALQGWCPPLPILRRMGIRTAEEIHRERFALKALRGDFEGVRGDVDRATEAVQR